MVVTNALAHLGQLYYDYGSRIDKSGVRPVVESLQPLIWPTGFPPTNMGRSARYLTRPEGKASRWQLDWCRQTITNEFVRSWPLWQQHAVYEAL